MRLYMIGILMILFSGCSTTTPAVTEYRIETSSLQNAPAPKSGCSNKRLKVERTFAANSLMTHSMNYGVGAYKQYAYTQAKWADTPNKAITMQLTNALRQSALFESVLGDHSRSRADLILESSLVEFMQYFDEDTKHSFVKIVIHFTLIDAIKNQVIDTRSFEAKVDAPSDDAQGGVVALNEGLKEIFIQNRVWLEKVCQ